MNLNARLKQHVGKYAEFQYGYLASPKAAYAKECDLFHDFNPPDNDAHPAAPAGTNLHCGRCGV